MSYPDEDFRPAAKPIAVVVREMPPVPFPKRPTKTVAYTIIIDGSNGDATQRVRQIAAYEPTRTRLTVHTADAPVNLVFGEQPNVSPDISSGTAAPSQGMFLPTGTSIPWAFYGCDAVWVNSASNTPTRVQVVKEYE